MERALGVVIGLGATYLFLSVVVLALVEALSTVFSRRAKALRECLEAALGVEATGGDSALFARLASHPLLKTLGVVTGAANKFPSRVPTPLFVSAFLDTVGALRGKGEQLAAAYQAALAALPDKERAVVAGIVGQAAGSVEELERRAGVWFDALMTQLSEKYRRNTQWVTRGITAVIVVAVNANALTMGATFWRDSVVREAAMQLATRELAQCELPQTARGGAAAAASPSAAGGAGSPPAPAPDGAMLPALAPAPGGATSPALAPAPDGATVSAPGAVGTEPDCRTLLATMGDDVPLPLGWTHASWSAVWQSPEALLTALLGLLLSFVAVCLGAPFWFDVLRRVTPLVRSPPAAAAAGSPAAGASASTNASAP